MIKKTTAEINNSPKTRNTNYQVEITCSLTKDYSITSQVHRKARNTVYHPRTRKTNAK